jgi:hypothetical protein
MKTPTPSAPLFDSGRSDLLQRKSPRPSTSSQSSAEAPPIVHDVLRSPGRPLDAGTRAFMDPRFGYDFSRVRLHDDSQAARSAEAVNAQAYAVGSHVVFGANQGGARNLSHQRLLAHELAHVVQQQGRNSSGPIPLCAPDHPAEHEAERSARLPTTQPSTPAVSVSPMLQRQVLPPVVVGQRRRVNSGTANPEPGLSITWTGDNIVIHANLQISGPAALPAVADEMKKTIEKYWNVTSSGNGHSYRISCTVNIAQRAENAAVDGNSIQVLVVRQGAAAASAVHVPFLFGARTMTFNLDRGTDWTPAHEFGHLLGLGEHYRLTATGSDVDRGWEGNIMADRASGSAVDYRNAEELLNLYAYKNTLVPPRPEETTA